MPTPIIAAETAVKCPETSSFTQLLHWFFFPGSRPFGETVI